MRSIHCPHCAGTIELLGTAEAADQLNVAPSHVRRLAEAGKVQATKVGRDWLFVTPIEEPAPGQRGNPNQCDRCGKFASHLWGVYGEGEWCDTCIEEVEEEMEVGSEPA